MPGPGPGPAFKNKPLSGPQIATDGTSTVFARVASLIRASIEMHGVSVRAWDDPTVYQSPPGSSGPPWVRLTPSPSPSRIRCRTPKGVCHEMPMTVEIETSTPGADVARSMDLWAAIGRAIFPGRILDAQLQYLGVSRIRINRPAWGAPMTGEAGAVGDRCEGRGSIELMLNYLTSE